MRKFIGLFLAFCVVILVFPNACMADIAEECKTGYSKYGFGDKDYIAADAEENKSTILGSMGGVKALYSIAPEADILLVMNKEDYEDTFLENAPYYLKAEELQSFDAVMICERMAVCWDLVEFVGFVRNADTGILQVSYSETVVDKVTLDGGRRIGLKENHEIVKHLLKEEKPLSTVMYDFVFGCLYGDAAATKYLHNMDYETCDRITELPYDYFGTVINTYKLSTGNTRILNIVADMHATSPIALQVQYVSNVKGNDEDKLREEAEELHKAFMEKYGELEENFPILLYRSYNAFGIEKNIIEIESGAYEEVNLGL